MKKAVFVDFYGTLVHEDGVRVEKTCRIVSETGDGSATGMIGGFWWERFKASEGDGFRTQRELEYISLKETIERFGSAADAEELSKVMFDYWVKPDIFPDTREFLDKCPVPVWIVSNIDTADVLAAMEYHGIRTAGVVSSEDARSYKPSPAIFRYALGKSGFAPEDVVHIGDSLSSDVAGARSAGIEPLWLNRRGKPVPEGVRSIATLPEAIPLL